MKKHFIIPVLLFALLNLSAQEKTEPVSEINYKRHAVYGTVGSLILWGHISINYDYLFSYDTDRFFTGFVLKAGFGPYYILDEGGFQFVNTVGTLIGKNIRHLELNAGYNIDFYAGTEVQPAGSLGYRYQKPGGYLFRMGVGHPEYFYLSFGKAF